MLGKINCLCKILILKLRYGKRLDIRPKGQIIRADTKIKIGKCARISVGTLSVNTNTHIECERGELKIGRGVIFNRNCIVACREKITIGDNCLFGPNVCLFDHDHLYGPEGVSPDKFICSEIKIGDSCWIGANTVILRGTHIGKNTVVCAGSVVKGEIPAGSLVLPAAQTRNIPLSFFSERRRSAQS